MSHALARTALSIFFALPVALLVAIAIQAIIGAVRFLHSHRI